ncbi:hypothetical protein QFZ63_000203 [Streptomyces sp. B3I7]|nr:hypothetical protein [Streptomyces sp. B3I7]
MLSAAGTAHADIKDESEIISIIKTTIEFNKSIFETPHGNAAPVH